MSIASNWKWTHIDGFLLEELVSVMKQATRLNASFMVRIDRLPKQIWSMRSKLASISDLTWSQMISTHTTLHLKSNSLRIWTGWHSISRTMLSLQITPQWVRLYSRRIRFFAASYSTLPSKWAWSNRAMQPSCHNLMSRQDAKQSHLPSHIIKLILSIQVQKLDIVLNLYGRIQLCKTCESLLVSISLQTQTSKKSNNRWSNRHNFLVKLTKSLSKIMWKIIFNSTTMIMITIEFDMKL